MSVQALIMINDRGAVDTEKQMEACSAYIDTATHLNLAGIVWHGVDGAAVADSIRNGEADVVVAAYRDPDLQLTGEIESVGGHVVYVQMSDHGRLTVRDVVASLSRRLGWSASTIARAIGSSTADVSTHLRRAGLRPPKK